MNAVWFSAQHKSFPLAQLALPKCQSSLGPGVQRRLALCWCGAGLKVQPVRGWKPTSGICSSGWVALQLRNENAVPTEVSPSYSEPRTPPSMRSWPGTGPTSTDPTKGPPSPRDRPGGATCGGKHGEGFVGGEQTRPTILRPDLFPRDALSVDNSGHGRSMREVDARVPVKLG